MSPWTLHLRSLPLLPWKRMLVSAVGPVEDIVSEQKEPLGTMMTSTADAYLTQACWHH